MSIMLVNLDAPGECVLKLDAFPLRVGRDQNAEVCVSDPWISRVHCQIDNVEGTLWIRDLGSKHGVFVNGLRVDDAHLLPGDRLTLGMTRFRIEAD